MTGELIFSDGPIHFVAGFLIGISLMYLAGYRRRG